MSKVLIFTDIHVHCHKKSQDRLEDCLKALDWVFQTAIKRGIKNILFLGDLFHDRQKIDVLTYQRTFEKLEQYVGDVNLYLLLGNHDLWHFDKCDISSVNPFRSLPGVTVVDQPSTLVIDGQPISFLPYTHDPINDIKKLKNASKFKILCAHLAIDGAILNTAGSHSEVAIEHDGEMVKCDGQMFVEWQQVFLGHYHAAQKVNQKVEYVGSPLELSFGEAFQDKHILIYDLESHEKEYVINDFSPKHLILHEADLDKYDLKGNFVKVVVDKMDDSNLIEMRHELTKNAPASLAIEQNRQKMVDAADIQDAKAILYKQDEMLERYIEDRKKNDLLGDLEEKMLLEIGQLICQLAMAEVG
jgi:DNA repair exonuclease SbcCD nuclease subunit